MSSNSAEMPTSSLHTLFLACLAFVAALASSPADAKLNILMNSVGSFASGGTITDIDAVSAPTSTNFEKTFHAMDGDTYATTTVEYFELGGESVLTYDMLHRRVGDSLSQARTISSLLLFTSTVDADYAFSGHYNVSDVGAAGKVVFNTTLEELGTSEPLFRNWQTSQKTVNEQLILGQSGGDTENRLDGSPFGKLVAGRLYLHVFSAEIAQTSQAGNDASAVGNFTLKVTAIPEPSTLMLLCGVGALALQFRLRFGAGAVAT